MKLKTVRKIRGRFLTRDQLKALLERAGESLNSDLPNIIRVMGATGLRRENVLAMRWRWFDASHGTLTVPAESDKAKPTITRQAYDCNGNNESTTQNARDQSRSTQKTHGVRGTPIVQNGDLLRADAVLPEGSRGAQ